MDGLKESWINAEKLPLVIEPSEPMSLEKTLEVISLNKEILKKKLLKSGGLLFRNFPFSNEKEFAALIATIDEGQFIDYIGGDSPRTKIHDGIYTSTEAPPSIKIPLHNELSFVKKYPKRIYFYCHVAPNENGETTVADARKVYNAVDSSVKSAFIAKGIKYTSNYYYKSQLMNLLNELQPSHKSWINVFETEHKGIVEEKCIENEFEYKWNQSEWLEISQKRPAVISHPITNEKVWFNQAHLYDFNPKLLGWWRYLGAKVLYCRKHMRLH
nr:TauD/TfdA family dioxygenase [Parachlamydiaceae bacterium]